MIKVSHIFTDEPIQLALTQDEEVIETFPTHTADELFAHRVGPGSAHRCADHIDPTALCHPSEAPSIFLVIVSNQEARSWD